MAIIDDPTLYFSTTIYTGDGNTDRAVTIDGTGMQPNMLWIKSRSLAEGHVLGDSVRGASERLIPNSTDAEATRPTNIASFTSTGFTVANGGVDGAVNTNAATYCSWAWKEQTGVFDIVSYTGSGSAKTVSHSLSAIPKMIIVKAISATGQWAVQHASLGATKWTELQNTAATDFSTTIWNDTEPTSSVFTVGTNPRTNGNGTTYIAYLFGDTSMNKMGSYTANANADGTFVYTGFKPAFVMIKNTSQATDWIMVDNKRLGYNTGNAPLKPNSTAAETNVTDNALDLLSNGFKLLNAGTKTNADSGNTFIYMAFAEEPFVTSTDNGSIPATAR